MHGGGASALSLSRNGIKLKLTPVTNGATQTTA